jgi:V/A-type H+-transporting ATPase subunit A
VVRVSGPIVVATAMTGTAMHEVVHVGVQGLVGEVVRLDGPNATLQVYEDTTLLRPGDPVVPTGAPLSVWLGPGLLGNIYDGIQRPLASLLTLSGPHIRRGDKADPLDTSKAWPFLPSAKPGEPIQPGQPIGEVQETSLVRHRILVPPDVSGVLRDIVPPGNYPLLHTIATLETPHGPHPLCLRQQWPVRLARPVRARRPINSPLITGQRVIDSLFPIGKGGAAAIPGGFGTGKTITQHQLAKWSDAEIIVFIGCGERGNEMTEVLREFPTLVDPRSGRPLMERTILIANTSNMPVAAREASIYTGITLAEYYRDQGLNVAVLADSTSRWAEALRELAARLEEMPAEEGFPASLPARLAQFYERGGAVHTLDDHPASISLVGAVSPPGADFSEPVTQHTRRFVRCFWSLDSTLANARHYPAIHWLHSYSEYVEDVRAWWEARDPDWSRLRTESLSLLQREERLQQIVRLVGPDVLPESQRWLLDAADMLKDGFLTQDAYDSTDAFCSPERQAALLHLILDVFRKGNDLLQTGTRLDLLRACPSLPLVIQAKSRHGNDDLQGIANLRHQVLADLDTLATQPGPTPPAP